MGFGKVIRLISTIADALLKLFIIIDSGWKIKPIRPWLRPLLLQFRSVDDVLNQSKLGYFVVLVNFVDLASDLFVVGVPVRFGLVALAQALRLHGALKLLQVVSHSLLVSGLDGWCLHFEGDEVLLRHLQAVVAPVWDRMALGPLSCHHLDVVGILVFGLRLLLVLAFALFVNEWRWDQLLTRASVAFGFVIPRTSQAWWQPRRHWCLDLDIVRLKALHRQLGLLRELNLQSITFVRDLHSFAFSVERIRQSRLAVINVGKRSNCGEYILLLMLDCGAGDSCVLHRRWRSLQLPCWVLVGLVIVRCERVKHDVDRVVLDAWANGFSSYVILRIDVRWRPRTDPNGIDLEVLGFFLVADGHVGIALAPLGLEGFAIFLKVSHCILNGLLVRWTWSHVADWRWRNRARVVRLGLWNGDYWRFLRDYAIYLVVWTQCWRQLWA